MVKSSKCYLSLFLLISIAVFFNACQQSDIIYERSYSEDEQLKLSESLMNGAGTDLYYQGTVGERMIIREGIKYKPNSADGQRELGVPYLKRGFAHEANKYYEKAAEWDPEEWLGYKAYCWLYFYRDYETALEEIDSFDELTPDFVDYPQSTSVNYMRGICYLHLGKYEDAVSYLTQHLEMEIKDVGHEYVDAVSYVLLGASYNKLGQYENADSIYNLGLAHNENTAELHYYKAENLIAMKKLNEADVAITQAQDWYEKGAFLYRPYVEEFYAIYKPDISMLKVLIDESIHAQEKD